MSIRFQDLPTDHVRKSQAVERTAEGTLAKDEIAYVHLRSATNNCYQCRFERA